MIFFTITLVRTHENNEKMMTKTFFALKALGHKAVREMGKLVILMKCP